MTAQHIYKKISSTTPRGFTLIELLVVIGILAVLLAITLIAINPAQQFQDANNTKRRSDVTQILNAIHQYAVDNNGQLPGGGTIPTDAPAAIGSETGEADLCSDLVPLYIAALPSDPETNNGANVTDCSGTYATGYSVQEVATGRVTVSAPDADGTDVIDVTR